jgi:hypothetical protein
MKNNEWNTLKQVNGCLLGDICSNQLHVSHDNNDIVLIPGDLIFKITNPTTLEFWYWRLRWFEDDSGDDYLIVNEQETPEPLNYLYDPDISPNQYLIIGSRYVLKNEVIKKVSGYGYKDRSSEILTSIVFDLNEEFVLVRTGPVMEVRIKEKEPVNLGDIIFSF